VKLGKKHKLILGLLLAFGIILLFALLIRGNNVAIFNPKGIIATKQRNLIVTTVLLSLIVVIPVYIMVFTIALKYRETNKKAKYTPDWDHSRLLETVWWGVPCAIILVLAVITWNSSHDLDPFKALKSDKKPLTVQVVALQWKWLFIYPEQHIASVNFMQLPEDTPINFEITSDAPMNSFWIPQLGGQVYAMSGMSTKLHLMADEPGDYSGVSANVSGEGFAGMKFIARAGSQTDFDQWVAATRQTQNPLGSAEYEELAKPSQNSPPIYYSSYEDGLYNTIIMKYMGHAQTMNEGGY
jgi:cytochrome o ubiquinol oxidase subunit II